MALPDTVALPKWLTQSAAAAVLAGSGVVYGDAVLDELGAPQVHVSEDARRIPGYPQVQRLLAFVRMAGEQSDQAFGR